MKIQIVQNEIEEAIRQYIHKQLTVKEGHEITMDFTASRGADGLIADIIIAPAATKNLSPRTARASVTPVRVVGAPAAERPAVVVERVPEVAEAPEPEEVPAPSRPTTSIFAKPEADSSPTVFEAAGSSNEDTAEPHDTRYTDEPDEPKASSEPDVVAEEDEREENERPLKPSIFSNLRRENAA